MEPERNGGGSDRAERVTNDITHQTWWSEFSPRNFHGGSGTMVEPNGASYPQICTHALGVHTHHLKKEVVKF